MKLEDVLEGRYSCLKTLREIIILWGILGI